VHHAFLLHDHRRTGGRVIEKGLRHFFRDPNATMRRGVGRDVALVHRVTATEEHRVRHPRAVVMSPLRLGILAGIDVGFHHIPKIVHVIAKDRRDVVGVLR
jgi:hypothetical protein